MEQVKFGVRLERVKIERPRCQCGKIATERLTCRDVSTREILSSTHYCDTCLEDAWKRITKHV